MKTKNGYKLIKYAIVLLLLTKSSILHNLRISFNSFGELNNIDVIFKIYIGI